MVGFEEIYKKRGWKQRVVIWDWEDKENDGEFRSRGWCDLSVVSVCWEVGEWRVGGGVAMCCRFVRHRIPSQTLSCPLRLSPSNTKRQNAYWVVVLSNGPTCPRPKFYDALNWAGLFDLISNYETFAARSGFEKTVSWYSFTDLKQRIFHSDYWVRR